MNDYNSDDDDFGNSDGVAIRIDRSAGIGKKGKREGGGGGGGRKRIENDYNQQQPQSHRQERQRYNYDQTLLELGRNSTFDSSRLSKSTVESVISHINLLKHNNIPIDRKTLTTDTIKLLDNLRDRRGDKLSSSYKLQIGMTIKRMFRETPVDLKKYNRDRYTTPTRVSSSSFMSSVKKIIDAASQIIASADVEIADLGMYDASLAVLLSSTTSLRIFEISQLKMSDIQLIMTNEAVNIQSKAHIGSRKITLNQTLLALLKAVERQRPAIYECLMKKKNDPRYMKKIDNYNRDFILLSSTSYMRKKLKELAAGFLSDSRIKTLGFNSFRKYITTILVNSGAHEIAQTLNNHSSLNTTLNYYNVRSAQTAESAYEKIDELVKSILPAETGVVVVGGGSGGGGGSSSNVDDNNDGDDSGKKLVRIPKTNIKSPTSTTAATKVTTSTVIIDEAVGGRRRQKRDDVEEDRSVDDDDEDNNDVNNDEFNGFGDDNRFRINDGTRTTSTIADINDRDIDENLDRHEVAKENDEEYNDDNDNDDDNNETEQMSMQQQQQQQEEEHSIDRPSTSSRQSSSSVNPLDYQPLTPPSSVLASTPFSSSSPSTSAFSPFPSSLSSPFLTKSAARNKQIKKAIRRRHKKILSNIDEEDYEEDDDNDNNEERVGMDVDYK